MGRGRLGTGLQNNTIRVLAEIILSGNKGITQEELSSRLRIHRTTINRITKRLEKSKIRSTYDGRYTRYTANTNAIQDVVLSSHFQAQWAAFHTLKSRNIERISHFADMEKLERVDPMTAAIFLFSVKVGALVTYLLKEALNPKSQFLSVMIDSEKDNLSEDQKYEMTLAWLRNHIITSLPAILYRFRENIFKVIATKEPLRDHNVTFDRWAQLMRKEPRHTFSDNVYGMVNEALRESFASISRDLDGTTRRLPRLIEGIYDYGYIERAKPDTSLEAQLRIHAKRMKKNHIHQFSVVGVKNHVVHKRCPLCGEEYMEPIWSRVKKDKDI